MATILRISILGVDYLLHFVFEEDKLTESEVHNSVTPFDQARLADLRSELGRISSSWTFPCDAVATEPLRVLPLGPCTFPSRTDSVPRHIPLDACKLRDTVHEVAEGRRFVLVRVASEPKAIGVVVLLVHLTLFQPAGKVLCRLFSDTDRPVLYAL